MWLCIFSKNILNHWLKSPLLDILWFATCNLWLYKEPKRYSSKWSKSVCFGTKWDHFKQERETTWSKYMFWSSEAMILEVMNAILAIAKRRWKIRGFNGARYFISAVRYMSYIILSIVNFNTTFGLSWNQALHSIYPKKASFASRNMAPIFLFTPRWISSCLKILNLCFRFCLLLSFWRANAFILSLRCLRRLTIVFRFSSTLTFDGFKRAK